MKNNPWTYPWIPVFLQALRNSANIRAACQAAGISREWAYETRRTSRLFSDAWDSAIEDAVDILEAEGFKRARESSDSLLKFFLTAYRRERFGDSLTMQIDTRRMIDDIAARTGAPVEWLEKRAQEHAEKYALQAGQVIEARSEPLVTAPDRIAGRKRGLS